MLDGKELDGKIGDVGSYSVDVKPDISVEAKVGVGLDRQLARGIKAKLNLDAVLQIDGAEVLLAQAEKTDNKILKFIAEQAIALRDGQDAHPAVVAAADPAAAPAPVAPVQP